MQRRLWLSLALLTPALLLLCPARVRADEPPSKLAALAGQVADLRQQVLQKQAELEALRLEKECLDADEPRAAEAVRLSSFARFENRPQFVGNRDDGGGIGGRSRGETEETNALAAELGFLPQADA